ncbi:hypothetical protein [Bordetella bronchiseptica]|uniref:hypothetical protein n=1 Tax=Bordetella bronchiseptica TaxID=518 RepID=UPI000FD8D097|nr:hypothetical protein [Bordetella bronchiseptica]
MIRKLHSIARNEKFNMPRTPAAARPGRAERATKNPARCADAPSPGLLRLLAQDGDIDLLLDSWWVLQGSNL